RHDMVVPLQSLGMTMEALSARLDRGTLTDQDLNAAVSKLNRLTRQAVSNCLHVASWMEPSEDDSVPLHQGVQECARLLASSLNFRGFALRGAGAELPIHVSQSAVRYLLAAAILLLADHAPAAGAITFRTSTAADRGAVTLAWQPAHESDAPPVHDAGQTMLCWEEVEALAALEGVDLEHGPAQIVLRFPRSVAETPLKMVPV